MDIKVCKTSAALLVKDGRSVVMIFKLLNHQHKSISSQAIEIINCVLDDNETVSPLLCICCNRYVASVLCDIFTSATCCENASLSISIIFRLLSSIDDRNQYRLFDSISSFSLIKPYLASMKLKVQQRLPMAQKENILTIIDNLDMFLCKFSSVSKRVIYKDNINNKENSTNHNRNRQNIKKVSKVESKPYGNDILPDIEECVDECNITQDSLEDILVNDILDLSDIDEDLTTVN